METFNVAIVGGGPGSVAILEMISADSLRQLRMKLVGLADTDPEAPGLRRAQAQDVFTTADYHDLFALEDLHLILELTGKEDVRRAIEKEKPPHVHFMDHAVARLFWDMMALQDEKLKAEEKQIKAVATLLKDVMQVEEERLEAERQAEEKVRAERDRTKKILNGLTEAVVVLSKDHVIEDANDSFLREFGSKDSKILGKTCFETIFDRNAPCEDSLCPFMNPALATLKTYQREITFQRHGEPVYYEVVYSPLRDEEGKYASCLVSMRDITHRKKLELDLEKSQKKYWKLFQDARDGIVLFNLQGQILETNLSLGRMLGYSREELEEKSIAELALNKSKTILSDHLGDLGILGFVSAELDFVRKSGAQMPVEANVAWLPEEEVFEAMVRDISVRRKLEEFRRDYSEKLEREVDKRTEQLRLSQQEAHRQKEIAEGIIYGSPTPMFVLDDEHRVTHWNEACEKLTGHKSEDMIGTDQHWKPFYPEKRPMLADLVMEGDIEAMHRLYDEMNLRESSMVEGAYEAEHYFANLGEEGTHLYFNAAPIKDDTGKIQGAIVTYQDFSERVKMTREIRRREAFVQNLIHNSIDGILATDASGKIVIFNEAAADILGYSADEIVGKMPYTRILSRQTTESIRNAFYSNAYGPKGKIINMEVEVLNKEGTPIPVRISGTLLYQEKKEVGSVVSLQDLREILRLQKEKAEAERMAAIGQTVAGLAHYIKNILNGLKGGAYVINSAIKKEDIENVGNGWRIVGKNIDQISNIVMDMLVYSKDRKPDYQMVDPNELAADVVELMKERAEGAGVAIVQDLEPGLEKVSMERTGIHRCLLNLVSNAIDACSLEEIKGRKGAVTVRTDRPEGSDVRFQVIDNGSGMTEETKKKLFTGFFSTKGYQGTGLGLPVTQKIVQEHGGELSFESQRGKGTTFTVLLPEVE